nr:glycosyltransferase family 2 protein [uncultured Carboxylicivirga sp.]
MKNTTPILSIIIPSFNQGEFIERTLLSILKQKVDFPFEVIVSDGGSRDNTLSILEKYKDQITYWSAPDKGFCDAVNKGLKIAKGSLIAIQSSDDYYLKDTFNKVLSYFDQNPDISMITGGSLCINENYEVTYERLYSKQKLDLIFFLQNGIPQESTFIKKDWIEKVGFLNEDFDTIGDRDLWYRIICLREGLLVDDIFGVYQKHSDQRTMQMPLQFLEKNLELFSYYKDGPFDINKFINEDEIKQIKDKWTKLWTNRNEENNTNESIKMHVPKKFNLFKSKQYKKLVWWS